MRKTTTKTRIKIVGATVTAVFSLAAVFTGTYAWFVLNEQLTATGMHVRAAVADGASIDAIKLIKFDYSEDNFGMLDYLHPEVGMANSYEYNDEEGTFGYFQAKANGNYHYNNSTGKYEKLSGNTGTHTWISVDTMNIYDPVEKIVKGGNLISLNCNAIYEISFTSTADVNYLQLLASKLTDADHTPDSSNNEVPLTDYVDFDVFFEEDLNINEDDTYSDTASYSIDDCVIFNGSVYKCTTAVEAPAGDFDENNWSLVTIPTYSALSTYSVNNVVFYNGFIYTCTSAVETAEYFDSAKWGKTETYSNSATYAVGAVTIHNGTIYTCTTSINSGESFTAGHWSDSFSNKSYFPTYSCNPTNVSERLYNKISYLSAQKTAHDHFYADTWTANKSYRVGDVVTGLNLLYKRNSTAGNEQDTSFDTQQWDLVSGWSNYSTTSSYSVDDIVLYNDYFYICNTAISAPVSPDTNAFDATKWTLVEEYSNNETYSQNDYVSYDRVVYECVTANSDANWTNSKWKVGSSYDEIELVIDQEVDFHGDAQTKIYINVNYAPSQADIFIRDLFKQIVAIHDFYFNFRFYSQLGGNS